MATLSRNAFIDATSRLLESGGYHGTSTQSILGACDATKGSLYHFFPEGKDELVAAAIMEQGKTLGRLTEELLSQYDCPAKAIRSFAFQTAELAETNGFEVGAPFAAIAQESASTNVRLRQACKQAYAMLISPIRKKYTASGISKRVADELATTSVATLEGAILLCRTDRSGDPLRRAGRSLGRLVLLAVEDAR